jgi:FG-GAP-like repeat
MAPKVGAFCADCHVMPRFESSNRDDWAIEVIQGFSLYDESGRADLVKPNQDDVLKFFRLQAPEKLRQPVDAGPCAATTLKLNPQNVVFQQGSAAAIRPPGITSIRWVDLGIGHTRAIVYTDIGSGAVKAYFPTAKEKPNLRLATLLQPVRVEPCDLDQDGLTDLVVADIGMFNGIDSDLGSVVWIRQKEKSELPTSKTFEKIVLREGLSRVADVQAGDFNGDQKTDLLVAEFGFRETGSIFLLENVGVDDATSSDADDSPRLQFKAKELDPRAGAVRVIPTDWNQDGHLDFMALIAQEHEVLEVFLNDGKGNFQKHVIFQGPDPAYCFNSMELVDLDADGDRDIVLTNGDSFDRGVKPYHSLAWLENNGDAKFEHHLICEYPGVQEPKIADLDGDGRLDIALTTLIAGSYPERFDSVNMPSIVLMMQTSTGKFERRQVETGLYNHLAIECGDFDGNGQVDLAAGNFFRDRGQGEPDLVLWMNESR